MANPISIHAAEAILTHDMAEAIKGFFTLPIEARKGLNATRRDVLVEMVYQLGAKGVLKFKRMLAALEAGDYETAADEMLDSLAARQTPQRWAELSKLMREG